MLCRSCSYLPWLYNFVLDDGFPMRSALEKIKQLVYSNRETPHCKCTVPIETNIPRMKLRGLLANFCIHVSASDLYITTIGPQMYYSKKGGIYKSLTYTSMQKLGTRPLGIFVSNFRCSACLSSFTTLMPFLSAWLVLCIYWTFFFHLSPICKTYREASEHSRLHFL